MRKGREGNCLSQRAIFAQKQTDMDLPWILLGWQFDNVFRTSEHCNSGTAFHLE